MIHNRSTVIKVNKILSHNKRAYSHRISISQKILQAHTVLLHRMIRKIYLLFSSTLFLIVFVQAQDPPDFFPCATEYETIEHSNPIMGRTCDCAGHLWVNPGCMEGYLCFDISGFGCHIV